MRNIPQNTGGISGSRASHRAKSTFVSTKGFDPGRERIFGSEAFRSLTRRTDLPLHTRFEPTVKAPGDIVI